MMLIFPLRQQPERHREIARLLHSEWSGIPAWSSLPVIEQRLLERNHDERGSFTFVSSTADGTLTGTASVIEYELDDRPERRFWLGEVFTPREWRGKGTGSALINACITRAGEQGIEALWLYTPDKQALYRRLGWQDVEQRTISGESVTIMVRWLGE
ncbi:GNAT family N-acetyltransferase [Erwinia persicina]|uniref:GNAT family N-acetyltransferase n=1 Tax=Erwinia persicina TaxID=55211 RepID=UPI003144E6E7